MDPSELSNLRCVATGAIHTPIDEPEGAMSLYPALRKGG